MSNTNKISSSVKDYVLNALSKINSDLDVSFCLDNNVQFDNHEVSAEDVDLFSEDSLESALKILGKK